MKNAFTPTLSQEQITEIRIALTHTYGKDYGIYLFNKLIVGLR